MAVVVDEGFHLRIDPAEVRPLVGVGKPVHHVQDELVRLVRAFPAEKPKNLTPIKSEYNVIWQKHLSRMKNDAFFLLLTNAEGFLIRDW